MSTTIKYHAMPQKALDAFGIKGRSEERGFNQAQTERWHVVYEETGIVNSKGEVIVKCTETREPVPQS